MLRKLQVFKSLFPPEQDLSVHVITLSKIHNEHILLDEYHSNSNDCIFQLF